MTIPHLKLVLLGDGGVGKTCIRNQFFHQTFSENYKATIGADFDTKTIQTVNGNSVQIQIWDTAGQERFHSLGNAFYRGADAIIVVYDVTCIKSFNNVVLWINRFLQHATCPDLSRFPIYIVANKIDMIIHMAITNYQVKQLLKCIRKRLIPVNEEPYLKKEVTLCELPLDDIIQVKLESSTTHRRANENDENEQEQPKIVQRIPQPKSQPLDRSSVWSSYTTATEHTYMSEPSISSISRISHHFHIVEEEDDGFDIELPALRPPSLSSTAHYPYFEIHSTRKNQKSAIKNEYHDHRSYKANKKQLDDATLSNVTIESNSTRTSHDEDSSMKHRNNFNTSTEEHSSLPQKEPYYQHVQYPEKYIKEEEREQQQCKIKQDNFIHHISVSAKTGDGIQDLFQHIVNHVQIPVMSFEIQESWADEHVSYLSRFSIIGSSPESPNNNNNNKRQISSIDSCAC